MNDTPSGLPAHSHARDPFSADDPYPNEAYAWHRSGRHLAPAVNVPLMLLSAAGQYRINYAARLMDPASPAFQGHDGSFYNDATPQGRMSRRLFMWGPHPGDGGITAATDLRRSGARFSRFAGYGLGIQLAVRFMMDMGAVKRGVDAPVFPAPWDATAIALDTGGVTAHMAEVATYNRGLSQLILGLEAHAHARLLWGQRLGLIGGLLQLGAGTARMAREAGRYAHTGHFSPATAAYASLDIAAGAAGVAYTRLILAQAAAAQGLAAQNNVLMHVVVMNPRFKWGLRTLGAAGAIFGLSINAWAYYEAAMDPRLSRGQASILKTQSMLGMAGSVFLLAGGLMVTAPLAPFAACAAAVGVGFLVAQSVYESSVNKQVPN